MTPQQAKFQKLLQRAVQIAALLPDPEDLDPNDPAAVAEVQMILTEFNKVNARAGGDA